MNRNFPDYFKQNNKRSQPETEAVKEWISKIQFVLSGNIHGGALVASYPFDNTPNSIFSSVLSSPSLTPDDDTFKHLAATYSLNHARMYLGEPCKVGTFWCYEFMFHAFRVLNRHLLIFAYIPLQSNTKYNASIKKESNSLDSTVLSSVYSQTFLTKNFTKSLQNLVDHESTLLLNPYYQSVL